MKIKSSRAFTLMELLVVMGIIALLAALLLPALTTARLRAYDADCATNLKQLGVALYQYALSEGGGYFPTGTLYNAGQPDLVRKLNEYFSTNSPAWFCKRYAKENGLQYKNVIATNGIGYFYWGFGKLGNTIYPIESTTTTSLWFQFYSTNVPGVVLASDRFDNNLQYHGGQKTSISLSEPASFVLLTGGTALKISPQDGVVR